MQEEGSNKHFIALLPGKHMTRGLGIVVSLLPHIYMARLTVCEVGVFNITLKYIPTPLFDLSASVVNHGKPAPCYMMHA